MALKEENLQLANTRPTQYKTKIMKRRKSLATFKTFQKSSQNLLRNSIKINKRDIKQQVFKKEENVITRSSIFPMIGTHVS